MTRDLLLADVVNRLGAAIEAEPNFDNRRKLKDARNLVRDVLWGTGEYVRWGTYASPKPAPEAIVPGPAAARERHP